MIDHIVAVLWAFIAGVMLMKAQSDGDWQMFIIAVIAGCIYTGINIYHHRESKKVIAEQSTKLDYALRGLIHYQGK